MYFSCTLYYTGLCLLLFLLKSEEKKYFSSLSQYTNSPRNKMYLIVLFCLLDVLNCTLLLSAISVEKLKNTFSSPLHTQTPHDHWEDHFATCIIFINSPSQQFIDQHSMDTYNLPTKMSPDLVS